MYNRTTKVVLAIGVTLSLATAAAVAADEDHTCAGMPSHQQLRTALEGARAQSNGGFNLDMWATIVNRDGVVCAVAFTGADRGSQWPGSRVISAQKANTANNFSLDGLALSTANLFSAVQPGGSLFGLQEANPINEDVAFGGDAANYGTATDFMIGKRIGGTNVFGGGVALYDTNGNIVGGVGVSGDTSCADHAIGWKVRFLLNLDNVPAGVADGGADDNIIYDLDANGHSASGFGQAHCIDPAGESTVAAALPTQFPIGPGAP